MADLPFCDICGRRLDPGTRFCDRRGRKIAFEEAAPPTYEPMLRPAGMRLSRAPRESQATEQKVLEVQEKAKPAGPVAAPQPGKEPPSSIPSRRFRITRRVLVLSVACVAAILIVTLAFFIGAIVLPPASRANTQTSSQVVTSQATGPLIFPTGQKASYEGLTDTNGEYVFAWHIIASADNIGTIQVTVSASKSGYQPGQAQTTFEAIQG